MSTSFPSQSHSAGRNTGVRAGKDNRPSLNVAGGSSADGLSVAVGTEKKAGAVPGCTWAGDDSSSPEG